MNILITGIAGFIGSHLALTLQSHGNNVVGIDNFNDDVYCSDIKYDRCKYLLGFNNEIKDCNIIKHISCCNISLYKCNIATDINTLNDIFKETSFDVIINLAAYANPLMSLSKSSLYIQSNVVGFCNILEMTKQYSPNAHFIYASTSSVYGNEKNSPSIPSYINDDSSHPISIYAASKKCNELFAYSYSSLYNIKTTGLRFFTVYGAWGRPDMAMFKFTKSILNGQSIDVYNYGNNYRDFTYIDDLVHCIYLLINNPPKNNYSIYNIGTQRPIKLSEFVSTIEHTLNVVADKNLLPAQKGDTTYTHSDMTEFINEYNYFPNTPFIEGVNEFVKWYKWYYNRNW